MLNYEYRVAFSETLDVLNHTKKEDVEKIPIKFLNFLKINALGTYESKLDFTRSILDMNLSQKTIGILSIIYKKYWCNVEQQKDFEEKLMQNEIIYQKQLSKKCSPNELFKEREMPITSNNDLVEVMDTRRYKRIFEKILNFFNMNIKKDHGRKRL